MAKNGFIGVGNMGGVFLNEGVAATAAYQQHINNSHGDLDNSSICKLFDPAEK